MTEEEEFELQECYRHKRNIWWVADAKKVIGVGKIQDEPGLCAMFGGGKYAALIAADKNEFIIEATPSREVFQLCATGRGQVLDGTRKIISKKIFFTRKTAAEYIPEFLQNCTTLNKESVDSIDPKDCTVAILDLELVDTK